jgi:hypothetical protein
LDNQLWQSYAKFLPNDAPFSPFLPGSAANMVEKNPGFPYEKGEFRVFLGSTTICSGADCRFRTGHLMITNQLLYQMS